MNTWFIDAWSPADGLAFASRREGGLFDAENLDFELSAQECIYLSPPAFEPDHVGGLATALAATRGHFQSCFYNEDGFEIAFERLEDLIQAVKRAYRASGGWNLPTTGAPLPILPLPEGPDLDAMVITAELWESFEELKNLFVQPADSDTGIIAGALERYINAAFASGAMAKLALLTTSEIVRYAISNGDVRPADLESLGVWLAALTRIGLYTSFDFERDAIVVWNDNHMNRGNGFSEELPISPVRDELNALGAAGLGDAFDRRGPDLRYITQSLARMPVTATWPGFRPTADEYAFLPTYAANLHVFLASNHALQAIAHPLELLPHVIAALVTSASWSNRGRFANDTLAATTQCAVWLGEQLPITFLGSEVEDALYSFATAIHELRFEKAALAGA